MKKAMSLLLLIVLSISIYGQKMSDLNGNITTNENLVQQTNKSSETKRLNTLNIISQIPSPIGSPNSLAFDGENLWVTGQNELQLFKISMLDGSIMTSIPTNLQTPYGMTFDGNHFLVADANTDVIQEIDIDGTLISTMASPVSQPSYCQGLAFDGTNIWFNDQRNNVISEPNDLTYEISSEGTVLNQYNAIGNFPTGITYDGTYIWSCDNDLDELHKIDPSTYSVLETYDTPGSVPTGLTFDGQYLWLVDNGTNLLYQLDIGFLSTSEYTQSNFIKIYPNPTSQLTTIDLRSTFKSLDILLYDLTGKLLQDLKFKNKKTLTIDLSSFASGMYYVIMNADGKSYTDKIMKE